MWQSPTGWEEARVTAQEGPSVPLHKGQGRVHTGMEYKSGACRPELSLTKAGERWISPIQTLEVTVPSNYCQLMKGLLFPKQVLNAVSRSVHGNVT